MEGTGPGGIHGKGELVGPAEFKAGHAHEVVAQDRTGHASGDVGRMGRDAECGHALAHVVRIGKAEMLLGRHVAEHRRARPRDHGAADGGRDVVVARTDVAHERPERVEGRVIAPLALIELVELDAGHRNVAGPLDHHLHVASTRPAVELPERPEFGELRRIVAVVEAARAQAVAERERQVVVRRNVEDLVKVLVEEVLPAEGLHPPGHHAASSGDDARQAAARKLDVGQEEPSVDRHVVDARPGLVLQDVPEDLPGERERIAACALERFVKRHGADGHGRAAQDHLAGLADAPAGREVHHGVRASGERLLHLAAFLAPVGGRGGSADIGVDLGGEVAADDGGLDLGMREGGGDDGLSGSHAGPDALARPRLDAFEKRHEPVAHALKSRLGERGGETFEIGVFACGRIGHFRRHDARSHGGELRGAARFGALAAHELDRFARIGGAVAARDVGHEEVGIPAAAEAFGRVGKPDAAQRDVLARLAPHEEAFASGAQVGIGMEVVVHNRAPEELK